MISKPILIVLLNNIEELGAYDIDVSNHMVSFCTTPEKEPYVYDTFGFCVYRLRSYNYQDYIYYVIQ